MTTSWAARRNSPSSLVIAHAPPDAVDPSAIAVMAQLARHPCASRNADAIRAFYSRTRAGLIAPLEPVSQCLVVDADGIVPLTIFRPAGAEPGDILPALIFFHGGGWTLGGLDIYEPLCRTLANRSGHAVIWVEYRLAPEHRFPAAVEDCWAASEWVQAHAAELHIDPQRIAVGGDSAGGNLAAVTAVAAREGHISFHPNYQLLLYPCLDMTASQPSHKAFADGYLLTAELYAWYRGNYIGADEKITDWRLSPGLMRSFKDLVPAIVLYAGFDPLVDEARAYASQLAADGVVVETLSFPRMIHGFLNMGRAIPVAAIALERAGLAMRRFAT